MCATDGQCAPKCVIAWIPSYLNEPAALRKYVQAHMPQGPRLFKQRVRTKVPTDTTFSKCVDGIMTKSWHRRKNVGLS